MNNNVLKDQIRVLSRECPTIHQALRQFDNGYCTYEEALQMAAIQLSAIVAQQQKTLVEIAMRSPAPMLMVPAK